MTGAEKFNIISKNSVEGIIIINDTGSIEEWNDYMVDKTKFSKAEILGRKIWDVQYSMLIKEWKKTYPVEYLRKTWMGYIQNLKENEFITKEGQFIAWNKELILTEDIICRITLQGKKFLYVIQRNRGQRRKIDREDVMASIISFELRSLISSLLDFSGFFTKESRRLNIDKLLNFIRQVISSSEHTIKLLQNFSVFLSVQDGRIEFNPVKIDLNPVIEDVLKEYKAYATSKNIVLNYLPTAEILCTVDINAFKIILGCLIDNAIKFTNKDGHVDISASVNQDFLEIRIRDDGIGIDNETKKKLFLSVSDVSTSGTNEEEGSGLGLILCKNLVEKHAGKIWVESEINTGSTFIFTIPVDVQEN